MSESSSSTCLSTWAVSLISLKPVVYSPHVWAEAGLRAACRWGRGRLRMAGLGTVNGRGPWSFDPPRRGWQGAASGRSVAGGRPGDPLLLSRAVGSFTSGSWKYLFHVASPAGAEVTPLDVCQADRKSEERFPPQFRSVFC